MRILFYWLTCITVLQGRIVVKDAGVSTLKRGDVGMIFYVTLYNNASSTFHIAAKMDKCCEEFGKRDMDCQMMYLMGGEMGCIHANKTKNISLLYPNMYLHNRRGQCSIVIKYTAKDANSTNEVKHRMKFDTFIYPDCTLIPPVLQGYYTIDELSICNTTDQDPLESCEPVDCHMKYLGNRNFFNRKSKQCQKVPICVTNPEKEAPDVSYFPTSNSCRDLGTPISIEDLRQIVQPPDESECNSSVATSSISANFISCHHGIINNDTGFCICNSGWISAPAHDNQFEPSLFIYHMCNIEISTWNNIQNTRIRMTVLIIAFLGALTAILLVMLSCICHVFYKCMTCDCPSICPFGKKLKTEDSENENSLSSESAATSRAPRFCGKICALFSCMNPRRTKSGQGAVDSNSACSHSHSVTSQSQHIESNSSEEITQ